MDAGDERELLLDFIDGSLTREAREELLDRMQDNPRLRGEFESLQALTRSLREMPEESPRADFAASFMNKHARPSLVERFRAALEALPRPAVPALAMAGALGCGLLFLGGDAAPEVAAQPLAGCRLVALAGQATLNDGADAEILRLEDRIAVSTDFEGSLVYEDGTRIKIHPSSEVVLQSRGLYLKQGSVWLNVTKDLKGFKVETPLALAAVKGTSFLVKLAEGAREMTVLVAEGFVEVASTLEAKLLGSGKGATVGADQLVSTFTVDDGRHQMFRDAEQGHFEAPGAGR